MTDGIRKWFIEREREYLPFLPTPLTCQSSALRFAGLAVRTTMCCMSRHVKFLLASSAKAQIPAASGADAEVPVWLAVHEWCKSVVTIYVTQTRRKQQQQKERVDFNYKVEMRTQTHSCYSSFRLYSSATFSGIWSRRRRTRRRLATVQRNNSLWRLPFMVEW